MRKSLALPFQRCGKLYIDSVTGSLENARSPIIRIENATFYRQYPDSFKGPSSIYSPLFPGLSFAVSSSYTENKHWAIIGLSSSGKTTFLQILQGEHLCIPPSARSFPYLSTFELARKDPRLRSPNRAIQYVGFNGETGGLGGQGTRGAYLSARYESRREATDFSLLDYLQGHTELNPAKEDMYEGITDQFLSKIIKDLRLEDLISFPVSNLSNGQTRRARIARAVLSRPEVLLLDEPFMGLDPPTLITLSPLLCRMAVAKEPRLVLTLRPQDPIPDWITHLIYLDQDVSIKYKGPKENVLQLLKNDSDHVDYDIGQSLSSHGISSTRIEPDKKFALVSDTTITNSKELGEILVEMKGVQVKYGNRVVLGARKNQSNEQDGLWWTVRRGQRWGVFGTNGSGKTTLISLICSDHPQTYSLPLQIFGQSRLPQPGKPGKSIFDIQSRIGQSSPEIHAFFPKGMSIRQVIENAYADTFFGKAKLDRERNSKVDGCLYWFQKELSLEHGRSSSSLDWARSTRFGEIPFSSQRVVLFLRAIIKNPDLVILDEAFSGMDEKIRDKCMGFLDSPKEFAVEDTKTGQRTLTHIGGLLDSQALICVSHIKEEVPKQLRDWIFLPEANEGNPFRFGKFSGAMNSSEWQGIWSA